MSPATAPRRRRLVRTRVPRVVGHGLLRLAERQTARWDRALEDIEATQAGQLRAILDHARGTTFGEAHRFATIRSHADFVRRVPLGDYDSHAPAIQRMRRGERGLLVPEPVRHFGCSSGSSTGGRPKYLPITARQVRLQQRGAADTLFRYLAWSRDAAFLRGFSLGLLPPIGMKREGPILVTSNPALMLAKTPRLARRVTLPDRKTQYMEDYDQKLAVIAERYLDHDVHAITGTTCWFALLFDKLLAAAAARGRTETTVGELWPNLRVLMGGGVSAAPYLDVIRERVGRPVDFVDTYNATEGGIYAMTDHRAGGPGLLMSPHRGVYYEFVPVEEVESAAPTRVPLHAVERDRLYAIVVTTTSGLYAYLLGDIVRFPEVDPPRIEFAGRLGGCLSTTQELTTHVEIQNAFEAACRAVPATAVDHAAGADVGVDGTAKSRYVLFAEFVPGRSPADPRRFMAAFDEALGAQNRVYREHRAGEVAILPPDLVALRPGAVADFMARVGNTSVQTKFPRIVDEGRAALLRQLAQGGPLGT